MTASADFTLAAREPLRQRVPDFFVVGHAKSGTSALYAMLKSHPQIYMSEVKEPSYFVPELRSATRAKKYVQLPETLEEYLSLFAAAKPGQRVGEATPSYLWSPTAAARIAEVQPDARIIAIFREPASFLRSLHLQFLKTDVETEADLRKAIALEPRRREGKSLPSNSTRPMALIYSDHVRYAEQLRRFHAAFTPERVLVLIYEDFRADNESTVREVLRFLDVDDHAPVESIEVNPAQHLRSPRLHSMSRSLYLGRSPATRALKTAIKTLTPSALRRNALAMEQRMQRAEPPPVDKELMRELRERYKSEVVAFSEYTGRDLVTRWGYDGVG